MSEKNNHSFLKIHGSEYVVGVLSPTPYGVAGEIVQGFLDADDAKNKQFKPYVSPAFGFSADRMRVLAHEIIKDVKPDIIITIGSSATHAYMKVASDIGCAIPVISVASSGSAEMLSKNLENCPPVAHIEREENNMLHASRFLHAAKPHVKKILLPYSDDRFNSKSKHEVDLVKTYFARYGVTVTDMKTHSMVESYHDIRKELAHHDTLMLLEGDLAGERHRAFSHECCKQGITLFSCSIEAPFFGASLGYAMSYKPLGYVAFRYAQRILLEGINANLLPHHLESDKRQLFVNTKLAQTQGLLLHDVTNVVATMQVATIDTSELLIHRPEYANTAYHVVPGKPSKPSQHIG